MCPLNFALITEVCSTLNTISSVGIHLTKCLPHSSLHLNRCNQGDVEAFVTLPKILLFFNFLNNTEVFTRLHINQQMPKLAVDTRTLSAEKTMGTALLVMAEMLNLKVQNCISSVSVKQAASIQEPIFILYLQQLSTDLCNQSTMTSWQPP